MYKLRGIYGKAAFDRWCEVRNDRNMDRNLRPWLRDYDDAARDTWDVSSYDQLVEYVSFLTVMNKRLNLFFRGQRRDYSLHPELFRETWSVPFGPSKGRINIATYRHHYWNELAELGNIVREICDARPKHGLPRYRTLRDVREAQWAVIQHYGLWPTPLIDLTQSLRVAASFALGLSKACKSPKSGYLYVVGMPSQAEAATFSLDDQLVLTRLSTLCPPDVKRAHLQEGFLVGRFPFEFGDDANVNKRMKSRSNLGRRLVAKFRLIDEGGQSPFWSDDFPIHSKRSLFPSGDDDTLLDSFREKIEYQIDEAVVRWHKKS